VHFIGRINLSSDLNVRLGFSTQVHALIHLLILLLKESLTALLRLCATASTYTSDS
jgi:hypothetical protein